MEENGGRITAPVEELIGVDREEAIRRANEAMASSIERAMSEDPRMLSAEAGEKKVSVTDNPEVDTKLREAISGYSHALCSR